jgi:hypothetical protein
MADELEPTQKAALEAVADRLRKSQAVAALVPDHVFGPDAASLARAGEWARCVTVQAGKKYPSPPWKPGQPPLLCQRDALVTMRAESPEMLSLLAVAVVRALNGSESLPAYQHCVHTNNAAAADGPGEPPQYVARVDTFALHCKAPDAPAPAPAPPAKVVAVPAPAPPPKLKEE